MNERRSRGLGKGLGALIPSGPHQQASSGRPIDVLFQERSAATADHVGNVLIPGRADPERPVSALPGSARLLHHPAIRAVSSESAALSEVAGLSVVTTADPVQATDVPELTQVPGARFAVLPVDRIVPNPRQPRTVFDEEALSELAESIRLMGVLQPVVVRQVEDDYELIVGERRLRATQLAGLDEIPAIIRDTEDTALLRDALVENLHRANLNPLEEAAAFDQLLTDFGCTHEELAVRLGCSRPHISNQLRLMKLPSLVQRRVAAGVLSAGHARALLGLPDHAAMERLAQRIVAEGLSVRATEEIVTLGLPDETRTTRRPAAISPHRDALDSYANRLSERLETRVKVDLGRRRGKMTVEFADLADLERIMAVLQVNAAE